MRKMFLMSVLMLANLCLWAQSTVRGKVTDATDGTPVAGANVLLEEIGKGTSANGSGDFVISQVPAGTYRLRVSMIGYRSYQRQIEVTADMNLTIQLYAEAVALDEVVVLGTRAEANDPVTQTTITLAEIERSYAGQDPSVVLERLSPSIISYSDAGADIGNYVQFRMRGMDQTRINTTLNGVPMNDMIDQGVFFSNFSDFGNSVQSVQVQRGVGISANGTASYAGSINFESIRLNQERPEFGLQMTGGSFGTFRVSGEAHTGKLANDMAFYTRFTRTISDGYKDHSGSDSYSFFVSGGYLGAKDILKITAFAGKTQNDQSYTPVLLADIQANPRTNYNSPNDTDDFEQELVQLQYGRTINDELTLNTTLYYGGSRGVFPFGLSPTNQLLFGLENDHYGLLSDIEYEGQNLNLKAGLHGYLFRRENVNSTAPNTSNPTYQDATNKDEISTFVRANVSSGKFNFFGDLQLRYTSLRFMADQILSFGGAVPATAVDAKRDWVFLNPKVGVNMTINDNSSVYASFGRTGREPTRTDILQGDGSSINEFNFFSALDENIVVEEYVNDFEIGYRYQGENLAFTTNFFYMDFENEISLVGALAQNSYVPLRQNVPDSRRMGLELTGQAQLSTNWEAGLNASFMSTNVSSFINAGNVEFNDVEHIFAPAAILQPSIRYQKNALGLGLNGRYVSTSFMELSNAAAFEIPDYFLVNAQVDVKISSAIDFSLIVNNLFDELYFTDGAVVDLDFDGAPEGPGFRVQPPRNFYAQLRFSF